jgi:uncharacterized membrane protein
VRRAAVVPGAFLAVGVGLIGLALVRGEATVGVFVVLPFVAGSSVPLVLGVASLFAAFLTLPLAVGTGPETRAPSPPGGGAERTGSSWGGVVVLGPVPLFFGRYRSVPKWVRYAAAGGGVALLVAFAVVVLAVVR